MKTGRTSRGHRFLGEDVTFAHPAEYEEKLSEQFVVASLQKRRAMIMEQATQLSTKMIGTSILMKTLLEEVNNLVEYQLVFAGDFEEKYLSVPGRSTRDFHEGTTNVILLMFEMPKVNSYHILSLYEMAIV